jgi:hypothetical protein
MDQSVAVSAAAIMIPITLLAEAIIHIGQRQTDATSVVREDLELQRASVFRTAEFLRN